MGKEQFRKRDTSSFFGFLPVLQDAAFAADASGDFGFGSANRDGGGALLRLHRKHSQQRGGEYLLPGMQKDVNPEAGICCREQYSQRRELPRLREKDLRGVEMNRRKFLRRILAAGTAGFGGCIVLKKGFFSVGRSGIKPKRFIWAKPMAKYPGRLKTAENIDIKSRWSG
jgi:hypothetical protein